MRYAMNETSFKLNRLKKTLCDVYAWNRISFSVYVFIHISML